MLAALIATALMPSAGPGAAQAAPVDDASAATPTTAAFTPLAPKRLLDTRDGTGGVGGRLAGGSSITLPVAGHGGVPPAGAVAVAFNLTAVDATGAGFWTASPSGRARPVVSNLNVSAPRQSVANLVVVALGASGAVDFYTQSGGDLIVDIAGYWTSATSATSGRFQALPPARVLDTREGNGAPRAIVGPNGQIDVQIAGRGGVPATGASSVVINVTATDTVHAGFVSAWPTGQARPLASVLNVLSGGSTVPNLVIVPLGAGGKASLYSQGGAHLIADVAGYFTDASAADAINGLFVALPPARILDSRAADPIGRLWPDQRNDIPVSGAGGVPASDVGAAILNLTGTEASKAGYVTAYPAVTERPLASSLNLAGPSSTVANLAFATLGAGGRLSLYSQSGTQLIADVAGYFLGAPEPPATGVSVTPPAGALPAIIAPPPAVHLDCAEAPTSAMSRLDPSPELAAVITGAVSPAMSQSSFRTLAYSVAAWSGPMPAAIATQPPFMTFVDEVFDAHAGAITADDLVAAVSIGYHEAIHAVQQPTGCLPTGVGIGHRWSTIGFPQAEIHDDVVARIDALAADALVRTHAKNAADVYLAGTVGVDGFGQQLRELNAYALELEWERVVGDRLTAAGVLKRKPLNSLTVAAKLHQLARYLAHAEQDPAQWAQLSGGGVPATVADYWNLIVANWTPGDWTSGTQARDLWNLAYGPDSAVVARYTKGAAGSVAPPRP